MDDLLNGCFEQLHEYQKIGVQWLLKNYEKRSGSVLADEMGLGKTIQTICFVLTLLKRDPTARILIVCPATLLLQWKEEFERVMLWGIRGQTLQSNTLETPRSFAPPDDSSNDEFLTTPQEDDIAIPGVLKLSDIHIVGSGTKLKQTPVILTSYEYVRLHISAFQRATEFSACILDEGHRIRNPNSQLTLALKTLKLRHNGGRIILTGTPLQNGLREFWTLIDFIEPGLLGTLPVFSKYFIGPIEKGGRQSVTEEARDNSRECLALLRHLILPHILRRSKELLVKEGVINLPEKQEHVVSCPLTTSQYQVYTYFLDVHNVQRQIVQWSRDGRDDGSGPANGKALVFMTMLLKICNHPDILLREVASQVPDFGSIERSGKLKVLSELLRTWRQSSHKVLIFSQKIQTLNIIEKWIANDKMLSEHGLKAGSDYMRIDGTVPAKNRLDLIDRFNSDKALFCMLLTTRVGGVGINLTGADRVVLFDPDWNPSMDAQAQERCWRIGQVSADVRVYRLLTKNTIEERIYKRQIQKTHIASRVLKNEDHKVFKANDFIQIFAHPPVPANGGPGLTKELKDLFVKVLKSDEITNELKKPAAHRPKAEQIKPALLTGEAALLPDEEDSSSSNEADRSPAKKPRITSPEEDDGEEGQIDEDQPEEDICLPDKESFLLSQLCETGAIASIEDHEKNIEQSSVIEFSRSHKSFAHRAFDALKASSRARLAIPTNVPTWTGTQGSAGKPIGIKVLKMSLSLQEQRFQRFLQPIMPDGLSEDEEKLFTKLCIFLKECDDGRSAAAIRSEFGPYLKTDEERRVFMEEWVAHVLANRDAATGRWRLMPTVKEVISSEERAFLSKYAEPGNAKASVTAANDDFF